VVLALFNQNALHLVTLSLCTNMLTNTSLQEFQCLLVLADSEQFQGATFIWREADNLMRNALLPLQILKTKEIKPHEQGLVQF
jgi:hypothetical protein